MSGSEWKEGVDGTVRRKFDDERCKEVSDFVLEGHRVATSMIRV